MSMHTLIANNIAKNSENKMHDDAVARSLGFDGGLVPGISVFGYMSHLPLARFGRAFLERGVMEARFLEPVYDGDAVLVREKGADLELECRNTLCATGRASLAEAPARVTIADFEKVAPIAERKPVSAASFPEGSWLGTAPVTLTEDGAREALVGYCETDPIYERENLTHPAQVLRIMNELLKQNALLDPWIHVSSNVQFLQTAAATAPLTARARVIANYERKGRRFAELDGLVIANDETPIARVHHVAIYQLRA